MDRRLFLKVGAGAALSLAGAERFFEMALADPPILDNSYNFYCPNLMEITEPGPIILPDSSCRCGWTRRPILDLNFEDAKFAKSKTKMNQAMKKWDMYHLYTPDHSMQFLIAWIPYAAFFNANLYDRKTNSFYEDTRFIPATPPNPMMKDSRSGKSVFETDGLKVAFEVNGEHHKISMKFENFSMVDKEGADLDLGGGDEAKRTAYEIEADLLYPNNHDSIAGVHLTNPRRCHYGHKINCMTIEGSVNFGGKSYQLKREDSFGSLDFGRGHYPRKMFWYWATASGRLADGRLVGFNLGYGNSPDNMTENATFVDGKIIKVNGVDCTVASDSDLMQPWGVKDHDGLVDLTFKPFRVRVSDVNIGSGYSHGRPALGLYSGKLKTADGEVVEIKDLFGLYEWVDSKW